MQSVNEMSTTLAGRNTPVIDLAGKLNKRVWVGAVVSSASTQLSAQIEQSDRGAVHYGQSGADNVPVINSLPSAAVFGMATRFFKREGLDAMFPQMAPRTGSHLVERAINVAGARLLFPHRPEGAFMPP